ncbi:MAG TPA: excalibur calcium-binding domain-containing protein [Terricaulis sp.]|nr:excalibur calcium-binding domain-containing protein [Terricaulis sp.]HRP11081.1 excalibur calcium-binding domain-containing protein [Terricaulis sp.]
MDGDAAIKLQRLEGPGSAERLANLRARFSALFQRRPRVEREDGGWLMSAICGVALGLGGVHFYELKLYFGSAEKAALHMLAAPHCEAARAVNLAPSSRGAPGYYAHHDSDGDGLACELGS